MEISRIKPMLEAILFASGEPVEVAKIAQALELSQETVYSSLMSLQGDYSVSDRGIEIIEIGESFQMCTKQIFAPEIKAVLEIKRNAPLSQAAMEILAIIAYNQPVTKGFIEQIRGVDSSQTVNSLAEKGLVEEAGRLDVPGRPIAYKTTQAFLRSFGLKGLDGLPPLPSEQTRIAEFLET